MPHAVLFAICEGNWIMLCVWTRTTHFGEKIDPPIDPVSCVYESPLHGMLWVLGLFFRGKSGCCMFVATTPCVE
jgi:hypothetical protein